MNTNADEPILTSEELLRAILALMLEEREQRMSEVEKPAKVELLLDGAGLGYQQIATLIGKNPDAVRKAISRAS